MFDKVTPNLEPYYVYWHISHGPRNASHCAGCFNMLEKSSVKWWKFDLYIEVRLGGVFVVWASIFILSWKSRRPLTNM